MQKALSWRFWNGKNKFYCDGRIMMGYVLNSPDNYRAVITFFLINVPATLFLGYTANWFATEGNGGGFFSVVLQVLSSFFLIKASMMNPGYLPKQIPPFEKGPPNAKSRSDYGSDYKNSDVVSGGRILKLKYCSTCLIYRPPRSSHCVDCDVCVERFDHHCPWLGNCVARRNYRTFLGFLVSTMALIIFDISYCCAQLAELADDSGKDSSTEAFTYALDHAPFAFVMIIYAFAVSHRQALVFIGGLFTFHMHLMCIEQTTAEKLKKTWKKQGFNPYERGSCLENFKRVFMTYKGPSHFELRSKPNLGSGLIAKEHVKLEKPQDLQLAQFAKTGVHTPEDQRKRLEREGVSF